MGSGHRWCDYHLGFDAVLCCVLQAVEFESTAVIIGNLGVTLSLVSYPLVCVARVSGLAPPARPPPSGCSTQSP